MGPCRDCKHWDAFDGPEGLDFARYFRESLGGTSHPNRHKRANWGWCALGNSNNGDPVMAATLAYGYDGEEYGGGMHTSPDFGCVQFEAKPT